MSSALRSISAGLLLLAGLAACSSESPAGSGGATTSSTGKGGSGGAGAGAVGGAGGATTSTGEPGVGPLPEGDTGLAAKHPGDVGLASDPEVIFFDDFESYGSAADLLGRWTSYYQAPETVITQVPENVHAGAKALEFSLPVQSAELSNAVDRVISPERDVVFLRYYSKYSAPFDITGSCHNGSSISAHYFVDGMATPGVPADGKNKFLAAFESWRGDEATTSPGALNVYTYHPEQRSQWGDHFFASGMVLPNSSQPGDFGADFTPRADLTPELDAWHCYELMVKANTPGQRDGRIAFWYDGKLAADFGNLRLRDVDTLKIDRFQLMLHAGANPNGVSKKWYDDVVLAGRYVGPRVP